MLNVIMLSVIMLSVIMLSVIMLSVIMLSVAEPQIKILKKRHLPFHFISSPFFAESLPSNHF